MNNLCKWICPCIILLGIFGCFDESPQNSALRIKQLQGLWCVGKIPKLLWEDSVTILQQKNISFTFDTLHRVKRYDWTLCVYGTENESYNEAMEIRGVSVRSTTEPATFYVYKGTYQLLGGNRIRMAFSQKVEVKFQGAFQWGQMETYERKYLAIPIKYDTLSYFYDGKDVRVGNENMQYRKLGYSNGTGIFTEHF